MRGHKGLLAANVTRDALPATTRTRFVALVPRFDRRSSNHRKKEQCTLREHVERNGTNTARAGPKRTRHLILLVAKKVPRARLLATTTKGSEPQQFVIRERQTSVGSDESNDFVVRDSSVSRRHAVIRSKRGGLELADLNSTNGTFLNGVRITGPVTFGPGDEIRFGGRGFFVLNPAPVSGTNSRSRRHIPTLGSLRTAAELVLFAFVVGFGIAQYLAYEVYHEQNKLLIAKAVPLPPIQANPGATSAVRNASSAAPASAAKSTDLVSKPIAPAVTHDAASSPDEPSAPDNLAAAVSLARLVPNSGQHVGEIAGDFSLPDSSGNLVNLSKYRGKVVFLNFWATWCGACRGEMASLESLYREFKGRRDFELVTISRSARMENDFTVPQKQGVRYSGSFGFQQSSQFLVWG